MNAEVEETGSLEQPRQHSADGLLGKQEAKISVGELSAAKPSVSAGYWYSGLSISLGHDFEPLFIF
jgi:hypothetical protein